MKKPAVFAAKTNDRLPGFASEKLIEACDEVTSAQIRALRTEAAAAGDTRQVVLCDRALTGEPSARRACAEAIESARAQQD